ncbi:MAG: PQQ-binding-like beta-propeller repeat protein [Planctomycetales bacterium]|nr:PQQ-binding-like beta-propeller repeat protein [Planctomycetales bacterium]
MRVLQITFRTLLLFGALAALGNLIQAEETHDDWTRFRGPNGTGVISECNVPLPWTPSDVAWHVQLPGIGNSSPVVKGNRIFLMSADPNSALRYLLCLDLASGKEIWRKEVASVAYNIHMRSSFASGTPCVDDGAVYFSWATPDQLLLVAMTHNGDEIWRRELGPYVSQHGFGTSPALFGDLLILFNSQQADELPAGVQPGVSRVTAFDRTTGTTVWETPRTTTRVCYGVPTLFVDPISRRESLLFCNTGDGMFALDLETGKPIWNTKIFTKRSVSCPLVVGDIGIGTEGSGNGGNILFAVDLKSPNHELLFAEKDAAPYVPSPVAQGNLVFLWSDKAIVSCIELPSGKMHWKERVSGNTSTSPVIAGDKVIGITEDGKVTILSASQNYHELGSVELGDITRATPLVAREYILFRTNSQLYCVGKPTAQ